MFVSNKIFGKNKKEPALLRREPITDTNLLFFITIGFFVMMYVVCMICFGGGYLRPNQFFDLFNLNAPLIIIACGLAVVMIAGGIDISVGAVSTFVCTVCVIMLDDLGLGVVGTLFLSLAIGLAFGAFQGFLISYLKIQPFIITLTGMFLARGATTMVSIESRNIQNIAFKALRDFRIPLPFGYTTFNKVTGENVFVQASLGLGVLIALVILVALFIILRWTRFGRNLYAVGGNSQNALTLGINVNRTKFFSYLLCGLFAGVAGFVYLLYSGSGGPAQFSGSEMEAIAACIIGGILLTGGVGNVFGSLFGVLSLAIIKLMVVSLRLNDPWWPGIAIGLVLSLFIVLQSVILRFRSRRRAGILKPNTNLISTKAEI